MREKSSCVAPAQPEPVPSVVRTVVVIAAPVSRRYAKSPFVFATANEFTRVSM